MRRIRVGPPGPQGPQGPQGPAGLSGVEFDVTTFGAIGNGVTNDTLAVQNALDAAEDAGGGRVMVPAGVFSVTGLTINSDLVHLQGVGESSVIRRRSGGADSVLLRILGDSVIVSNLRLEAGALSGYLIRANVDGTAPTAIQRLVLRDLKLLCDFRTSTGIFVGLYDTVDIERCHLENTLALADVQDQLTFGIVLHSGDTQFSKNAAIRRCTIRGFYDGIESFGTGIRQHTLIEGNTVRDAKNVGIYNYRGAQARIVDNHVTDCAAGIFADSSVPADLSTTLFGNTVEGNQVRRCTTYGILTEEHQGASIVGNTCCENRDGLVLGGGTADTTISGNNCSRNTRYGIWTDKSLNPVQSHLYDLTFVANTCKLNGEDGMRLGGIKRSCVVVGNSCCDNGTTAASLATSTFAGIRLGSNSSADTGQVYIVMGNALGNDVGAFAGTGDVGKQGYGLLLDSASVLSAVTIGNMFAGNGQFNIRSSFNFLTLLANVYRDGTNSLPSAVVTALGNTGGGFAPEADVLSPAATVKSANYTVLTTDRYLVMRGASANVTFTLPATPLDGQRVAFGNHDSVDNLTLARNGRNINGAAADLTLTPGQRVTLYYVTADLSWYAVG
jgi:parallel beta-helix repeat protein